MVTWTFNPSDVLCTVMYSYGDYSSRAITSITGEIQETKFLD